MITISQEELNKKIRLHMLWLNGDINGKQLILKWGTNLRRVNLSDADLSDAGLSKVILRGANLRGANLQGVNLTNANLQGADLSNANLKGANLQGVRLNDANLRGSDLTNANLQGADLRSIDSVKYVQGQRIISVQVDTSRRNNPINYWIDLKLVTTGCFQGTLQVLKNRVKVTHENNKFLLERYIRAIKFIEDEVEFYRNSNI